MWWRRALEGYTRYFAVWVILFGVVAWYFPAPFLSIQNGLKFFFALTMFGIGVALKPADFLRIAEKPGVVAIGCAAQFTIMPFGAWLVARFFNLPDDLAMGLILTGAAPGAMASNVMTYVAKADTAYSVSLTTVSTLLCPILTPVLTLFLAHARMEVPFWSMVLDVTLTVVAPVLVGFAVRNLLGKRLEKILPVFPAISATFIVFITSMVIALNHDRLMGLSMIVLVACLTLNLWGMAGGYAVGYATRLNQARRRTLSIEVGMQNAGLGVVLALKHFGTGATIPSAVFVFACIITASLFAVYWQRRTDDDDNRASA